MISERIFEWGRTLAQFKDMWSRIIAFQNPVQLIIPGYDGTDTRKVNINAHHLELAQQVSRAYIPPVPANR